MDTNKTKDNVKTQRDLAEICNHPTLEFTDSGGKLWAPFCHKRKDIKEVLRWIKKLKFPDGYTVGLKRVVNLNHGDSNRCTSYRRNLIHMTRARSWQAIHGNISTWLNRVDRFTPPEKKGSGPDPQHASWPIHGSLLVSLPKVQLK
jgi:hypothetical protein